MALQQELFTEDDASISHSYLPFKTQLLKWIGNKQRFAHEIISYFPKSFGTYYEPFVGSGAVTGVLAPKKGVIGDILEPLIQIWQKVILDPQVVKRWYAERYKLVERLGKEEAYEKVKDSYNKNNNPADLLVLSRTCYGGVVRFRQADGYMSTPCGVHSPVSPESFNKRVDLWHRRLKDVTAYHADFQILFDMAQKDDLIYCDPPYFHTQSILYGAQTFSLKKLFQAIEEAKGKGVYVALSIDGSKKSGKLLCSIDFPKSLFKREALVNCGRSMLRRFQMKNETLAAEVVADRLLLTW